VQASPDVMTAQAFLAEFGYYDGPPNGIEDGKTAVAIAEYLQEMGRLSDPVVTSDLITLMRETRASIEARTCDNLPCFRFRLEEIADGGDHTEWMAELVSYEPVRESLLQSIEEQFDMADIESGRFERQSEFTSYSVGAIDTAFLKAIDDLTDRRVRLIDLDNAPFPNVNGKYNTDIYCHSVRDASVSTFQSKISFSLHLQFVDFALRVLEIKDDQIVQWSPFSEDPSIDTITNVGENIRRTLSDEAVIGTMFEPAGGATYYIYHPEGDDPLWTTKMLIFDEEGGGVKFSKCN